jgi:hypothetical protein
MQRSGTSRNDQVARAVAAMSRWFWPPLFVRGKLAGKAATSSLFLLTIAGENFILS